jgi:hypothetical protein
MASDFDLPSTPSKSRGAKNTLPVSPFMETKDVEKEILKDTGLEDETPEPKTESIENPNEPKYPDEELLRVFDEIIFSGEYLETFDIKGRIKVTFKTRTAEDINKIQKIIDSSNMNLISSVETLRSFLNLQYSLVEYHKHDLSTLKYEEKSKFIENLAGPIVGMLLTMLAKFDHKVAKACEFGEKNF